MILAIADATAKLGGIVSVFALSWKYVGKKWMESELDYSAELHWAATVVALPLHTFVLFSSLFLLSDGHRRRRMGGIGVLHTVASLSALVSAYWLTVPWLYYYEHSDLQPPRPYRAAYAVSASSMMISSAAALGLLWMIPPVSKKHSRFFAGALCTCLSIATANVSCFFQTGQSQNAVLLGQIGLALEKLHAVVLLPSIVLVTLNFVDVWSNAILNLFNRQWKKRTVILAPTTRNGGRRSSAAAHSALVRTFWRSFRKSDFLLYLFPLVDDAGKPKRTSGFGSALLEPEAMRADSSWVVVLDGELAVVLTLFQRFVLHSTEEETCYRPETAAEAAIVYNFYSLVTFAVTLVLKGKLTTKQFKVFIALAVSMTGLHNASFAPRDFFTSVLFTLVLGWTVQIFSLCVSEPKSEKAD